jgi:hypothetical protein
MIFDDGREYGGDAAVSCRKGQFVSLRLDRQDVWVVEL